VPVYVHAGFAPQPFAEASVIRVAVGQDHAADVARRPAQAIELGLQVPVVAWHARIDHRQARVVLDEIDVDQVGADPVQVGCELHCVDLPELPFVPL
jgi:hypothetical protein